MSQNLNIISWLREWFDDIYDTISHNHNTSSITDLYNKIYPIGSIYITTNNINPSTLFGGCWVQIEDKFLLGSGSNYSLGSTGGEATVTLTGAQTGVYNHAHTIAHTHNAGSGRQFVSATKGKSGVGEKGTTSGSSVYAPTIASSDNWWTSESAGPLVGGGNTADYTATNASEAHNNMPPYLTVYIWKRIYILLNTTLSDLTKSYMSDDDIPAVFNTCTHSVTYNNEYTQIRINEGNSTNTGHKYYMVIPFFTSHTSFQIDVDFYTTNFDNDDFGIRICDINNFDNSYGAWIITGQRRLAYGYGGREAHNTKYYDTGQGGSSYVTNNTEMHFTMRLTSTQAYYCLKLDSGTIIKEDTYTRTDSYNFSGNYYLYIGGGKFSTGNPDKSVYIKNLLISEL